VKEIKEKASCLVRKLQLVCKTFSHFYSLKFPLPNGYQYKIVKQVERMSKNNRSIQTTLSLSLCVSFVESASLISLNNMNERPADAPEAKYNRAAANRF
jgi:hypothetical protein